MVLQKMFPLSIIENMRWGNENATLDEIQRSMPPCQCINFIEAMPDKYETYVEQGGTNFSEGKSSNHCKGAIEESEILF